ncbi:MAG: hypothetical protein ACFFCS_18050 [Candidatus Hodarchaeota archaeon]
MDIKNLLVELERAKILDEFNSVFNCFNVAVVDGNLGNWEKGDIKAFFSSMMDLYYDAHGKTFDAGDDHIIPKKSNPASVK